MADRRMFPLSTPFIYHTQLTHPKRSHLQPPQQKSSSSLHTSLPTLPTLPLRVKSSPISSHSLQPKNPNPSFQKSTPPFLLRCRPSPTQKSLSPPPSPSSIAPNASRTPWRTGTAQITFMSPTPIHPSLNCSSQFLRACQPQNLQRCGSP